MHSEQDSESTRSSAYTRSVSFWLSMFLALSLYSLAVLSPKLAMREDLRSEYHSQQIRLLRDEQTLNRLNQVSLSLKQNSRFVEELLRQDLKSKRQDEEIIPLEGNLVYRESEQEQGSPLLTIPAPPWYAPVISAIGESSDIRGVLLLSSVVLILFAFGFLQITDPVSQDSEQGESAGTHREPGLVAKWLSRYAQASEEEQKRKLLERLAQLESDGDWELDTLPVDAIDEDEEESSLT